MYKPKAGENWHLKSDKTKVLTVNWANDCGYVGFTAPWMKQQSRCTLETFHKRYSRVPDFYDDQIKQEIKRLKSIAA